ncbi:MmpS family transport accessory protein [Kribbella sp. NPDC058245]|uniref:MmpS family transport accessory protein n=1 Tax=Kribbella sp. NPDC058245 TaxID=3346399 RepID=UPI0036E0FE17
MKLTTKHLIVATAGIVAVGITGCSAAATGGTEHTVVYKISGTSKKADLTYTTDGSTTTEQSTGSAVPWTKTLKIKTDFPVYQVSAQNSIGQKGTLTCVIEVDGKQVKTATAKGEAAIAACDYSKS